MEERMRGAYTPYTVEGLIAVWTLSYLSCNHNQESRHRLFYCALWSSAELSPVGYHFHIPL